MSEIVKVKRKDVVLFDPERHRLTVAALDFGIEEAKRIKDWPKLEVAVDAKIDELQKFIAWRDGNIRGVGQPQKKNGDRTVTKLSDAQITKISGVRKKQAERIANKLAEPEKYRESLLGASYRAAMLEVADNLIQQSLSNEHYTPAKYIDAARKVLGEIDLDPASCEEANRVVKAAEYFDKDSNGLERSWQGRVWLNPPYGSLVGKFIGKLSDEFDAGNLIAAIALVNAHCTDTAWFQKLWGGLFCFTDHRINFYGDDTRSGSTHGSVFVYFGQGGEAFIKHFCQFGPILKRV